MNVAGYVRVSSEEQAISGISLEAQREKIKAYCALKDFTLTEIIEDSGISGKNLNRPGAQRIIEMARTKQINGVVVLKLDRMFRNTVDALETTRLFEKKGVAFHSIQESLDTQSALGRFFFTLIASLAELERGIIGERTKIALQQKRANGQVAGNVPYGFRLCPDGKSLELNPQEQDVLEIARDLRVKKYPFQRIADCLTEKGYTSRAGKPFGPGQIARMVAV